MLRSLGQAIFLWEMWYKSKHGAKKVTLKKIVKNSKNLKKFLKNRPIQARLQQIGLIKVTWIGMAVYLHFSAVAVRKQLPVLETIGKQGNGSEARIRQIKKIEIFSKF